MDYSNSPPCRCSPTNRIGEHHTNNSEQLPPGLSAYLNDVEFPVAIIARDPIPLIDNTAHDPMHGGNAIRAAHGLLLIPQGAGTLGGFATDTMFGGMVGVTCAYVIAESDQEVHQGDPIFQPDRSIGSSDDKPSPTSAPSTE